LDFNVIFGGCFCVQNDVSTKKNEKKQMERTRHHTQKMQLKFAKKVCEPRWMPAEVQLAVLLLLANSS